MAVVVSDRVEDLVAFVEGPAGSVVIGPARHAEVAAALAVADPWRRGPVAAPVVRIVRREPLRWHGPEDVL